jgi:hypothetical protein
MQYWESNLSQLEYQLSRNKEYNYSHTVFELCPLKEYLSDVTPTDLSKGTQQTIDLADQISKGIDVSDNELPF